MRLQRSHQKPRNPEEYAKSRSHFFLISLLFITICTGTTETVASSSKTIAEGKDIVFSRSKGNCLSCHDIPGSQMSGNIAPPLVAMKARYPERENLKKQIWDASVNNPYTFMPPFGRHEILTHEEIEKVVDFIHSL